MTRFSRELIGHAGLIGPKYLACSASLLMLALSLYWMADQASRGGGQWALLLMFLVASVFLAGCIGAAVGLLLFPAAQAIVMVLRLPKEFWPAAQSLICGSLHLAMALAYMLWVYGSMARMFAYLNEPAIIILGVAVVTGLVSGFVFGTMMMKYAGQGGRLFR